MRTSPVPLRTRRVAPSGRLHYILPRLRSSRRLLQHPRRRAWRSLRRYTPVALHQPALRLRQAQLRVIRLLACRLALPSTLRSGPS